MKEIALFIAGILIIILFTFSMFFLDPLKDVDDFSFNGYIEVKDWNKITDEQRQKIFKGAFPKRTFFFKNPEEKTEVGDNTLFVLPGSPQYSFDEKFISLIPLESQEKIKLDVIKKVNLIVSDVMELMKTMDDYDSIYFHANKTYYSALNIENEEEFKSLYLKIQPYLNWDPADFSVYIGRDAAGVTGKFSFSIDIKRDEEELILDGNFDASTNKVLIR